MFPMPLINTDRRKLYNEVLSTKVLEKLHPGERNRTLDLDKLTQEDVLSETHIDFIPITTSNSIDSLVSNQHSGQVNINRLFTVTMPDENILKQLKRNAGELILLENNDDEDGDSDDCNVKDIEEDSEKRKLKNRKRKMKKKRSKDKKKKLKAEDLNEERIENRMIEN